MVTIQSPLKSLSPNPVQIDLILVSTGNGPAIAQALPNQVSELEQQRQHVPPRHHRVTETTTMAYPRAHHPQLQDSAILPQGISEQRITSTRQLATLPKNMASRRKGKEITPEALWQPPPSSRQVCAAMTFPHG